DRGRRDRLAQRRGDAARPRAQRDQGLLPEAHGPPPAARHRPWLGGRPDERPADTRPPGGGRVIRSCPYRRHRPPPGAPPTSPALRRAGGGRNAATRDRRARLPPRSRVLPAGDVPLRRAGLQLADAGVAAGTSGLRRGGGPVLVRRRVAIDRIRRVPAPLPTAGRSRRRRRRGVPAPVRAPPRDALGGVSRFWPVP